MSGEDDLRILFDNLSAPFTSELIEWRVGSTTQDKKRGMALAYIDARTVQDRFDTVCGPGGWQTNYTPTGQDSSIICNIGVRAGNDWVWRANGAGKTDFEAEKGMYSDAFKRAAVMFGVGRYLYDLPSPWVELDGGKKIADSEQKKLDELYENFAAHHGWGSRPGTQVYRLLVKTVGTFVIDQASAQEFKDMNKGEIALLPAKMKQHLFDRLDRVGATQAEAAE